jgi:hypothetical protein
MSQFHQAYKRIVAVDCTGDLRHNGGETMRPFGGAKFDDGRRSWPCVGRLFIKVCWSPSNSPDRPQPPQISHSPRAR